MYHTPLTWAERGRLWLRLGIRLTLFLPAIWAVWKLLPPAISLLAPFAGALVCAALLNSPVRQLQKRLGWNRNLISGLVLVFLLIALGAIVFLLLYGAGTEAMALAQNWDSMLTQLTQLLQQTEHLLHRLAALVPPPIAQTTQRVWADLSLWLQENISLALTTAAEYATNKAFRLPSFLLGLAMFVLATWFLTADYPYLRIRVIGHMDEGCLHFFSQLRATALAAFGGYLRAQALLSVGVFFILLGGFLFIRQSYALLLAFTLAVLDFIPIVGAGTVMLPWGIMALVTRNWRHAACILTIWGITAVFRRFAEPKILGDQTGLSPILSLVSIYIGMKLAGIPGMILGPILTLVVLNLAGLGVFRGIQEDLSAAARDLSAILSQRPHPPGP